jgi:YaiO family outer membrane protein
MQRNVLILFILSVFMVSAGFAQENNMNFCPKDLSKPESTSPTLAQIQSLRQADKLSEAESVAKTYLILHPNDLDILLQLGLIYLQQKDYVRAEMRLSEVLAKKPDYADARIGLIKVKLAQDRRQEAESLLNKGLVLTPNNTELLQLKKQRSEHSNLDEIKKLRAQGKLVLAKDKAIQYLKINPKDLDIELILGLIYFQQKHYEQAETHLKDVLIQKPDYTDARVGLIKVKLAQNKLPEAESLLQQGLSLESKHQDLLLLKKQIASIKAPPRKKKEKVRIRKIIRPEMQDLIQATNAMDQKNYKKARIILKRLIAQYPNESTFRIALAELYLRQHKDMKALFLVKKGLKNKPYEIDLLMEAGKIHTILRQYSLAARDYQKIEKFSPQNKKIQGPLAEINSISPRYTYGLNEVGIWSDNAYVSDVHSIWDYSGVYYSRDTSFGRAIARLNYASRFDEDALQYELGFSPRFNRNIYMDLGMGFSNEPAIFPNKFFIGEGYVNVFNFFELSGGGKYAKIAQTYLATYTGSFSIYPGKYWFSFRPYYFVPKGNKNTSILYTLRARRYFGTDDHYLGLGAGSGRSPDLADLLTVNFFVIKNDYVNINYSFPIFKHHIIVELGAGYQRWQYPFSLVRKLYDGSILFKYRF